jgi:hypothetical protein
LKVDFDELIAFMDKATGRSAHDIRSCFSQFSEALLFYLPGGSEVQTPFGSINLNAQFRSGEGDDSVPPQDRKIGADNMRMQLRADRAFLARLRRASSVDLVAAPSLLSPSISRVENAELDGSACIGSPGQTLHIFGKRLRFDKSDQEQGVFLFGDTEPAVAARMAVYSRVIGAGRMSNSL